MFLVTPAGTLYSAAINSMPFARPDLNELKNGIKWILANDYPPRGQSHSQGVRVSQRELRRDELRIVVQWPFMSVEFCADIGKLPSSTNP
jgi:hypothetical protein